MTRTIKSQFGSRDRAELVVEHLVQEHGIARNAVRVSLEAEAGTAGNLTSRVKDTVWATVDEALIDAVISTYAAHDGTGVGP